MTTNGSTTTFGYDGLGRRVRQTVNGVTTRSLHDGDHLVVQTDGAGTRQLEFSYYPGIDHPHAVRESATGTLYYATGWVVSWRQEWRWEAAPPRPSVSHGSVA